MSGGAVEDAWARYDAGEFKASRRLAMEALEGSPDDPELLRIAGRAGVELGSDDAVEQLRKVTELRPGEAESWRDLGDAYASDGETDKATEAFRKALEIDPNDETSLTALGHAAYATGSDRDAVSYLEQAAERSSGASSAMISLVDMYREMGQHEEALAAAARIAEASPTDTAAAIDVAELSLEVGRLDEAAQAFERIRRIDELADHDVYALHGLIKVELLRDGWERALELAREAATVDRHGRTAGVLAFVEAQAGDDGDEEPPSREEVDAALTASLEEHRRLHAEDHRAETKDLFA